MFMAWSGQKGMPIRQTVPAENKCFLEHGCVQGRKSGPSCPQRLHWGGSMLCLWGQRPRISNEKKVIQTITWKYWNKKEVEKWKERWVRRKQAQMLKRKKKRRGEKKLYLVQLSWLSIIPTSRSPVWLVGSVPSRGRAEGNRSTFFPLSFSLLLPLKNQLRHVVVVFFFQKINK